MVRVRPAVCCRVGELVSCCRAGLLRNTLWVLKDALSNGAAAVWMISKDNWRAVTGSVAALYGDGEIEFVLQVWDSCRCCFALRLELVKQLPLAIRVVVVKQLPFSFRVVIRSSETSSLCWGVLGLRIG